MLNRLYGIFNIKHHSSPTLSYRVSYKNAMWLSLLICLQPNCLRITSVLAHFDEDIHYSQENHCINNMGKAFCTRIHACQSKAQISLHIREFDPWLPTECPTKTRIRLFGINTRSTYALLAGAAAETIQCIFLKTDISRVMDTFVGDATL